MEELIKYYFVVNRRRNWCREVLYSMLMSSQFQSSGVAGNLFKSAIMAGAGGTMQNKVRNVNFSLFPIWAGQDDIF